ncbi:CHAP domain-containing protein [Macrococcus carouselicus]|uniref:CHAP domain-containing protein n=1 Tax=Macrococcus carouselicus TaxID=69969 RepID=A0A9Q8CLM9_9STAP|nr:CHAP domain-containing protein [Macrococcus carouselicus]TDM02243.1 CHAP domain-containing protein [Macrococcus carouselicus]
MKKILTVLFLAVSIGLYQYADEGVHLKNTIIIKMTPDPMAYNPYDKGQCTYYAFNKVKADGNMIGRSWHDAKHWADRAKEEGYQINQKPAAGSLLQSPRGKQGHVAYVEKVYRNGNIKITEMNYTQPYQITSRQLTTKDIKRYQFIHPKKNPKEADRGTSD